MKLFSHITILLLTIFFSGTLPLLAQAASTGAQLSGTILDPNGAVVPGATVTLHSVEPARLQAVHVHLRHRWNIHDCR